MTDKAILYLEADEEIPSVIDRLREEKSSSIMMVIPKSSILLQSVVNLKLILRLSQKLKKTIAIVSHDPIGRNLAAQVGIPAFDSVNAKMPVLAPIGPQPDSQDVMEVNLSGKEKEAEPPVRVNHFQEDEPVDNEIDERDEDLSQDEMEPAEVAASEIVDEPQPEVIKPIEAKPLNEPYKVKKENRKKFGLLWAALCSLLVIIIAVVIFYPKATLSLTVKGDPFEGSVDIVADKNQKETDINNGIIKATTKEVTEEKSQSVNATGTKDIGEKAAGEIDFYNNYSTDPQQLPAGSRLSKDSKTFITTEDITIPGATLSLSNGQIATNPGHTTGKIEATGAGEDYNVSPGQYTISDYSGSKQSKIYGQSDKQLTGGSSKQITVVSQEDIDKAKDSISKDLLSDGKKDLTDQLDGLTLLDEAIKSEVISSKSDTAVGDEANSFNLDVKIKVTGLAFDNSSFRTIFLNKINQQVPDDKELLLEDKDQISTEVKDYDSAKGLATITGKISTKVGPKVNQSNLKAAITGKTKDQALKKVKSTEGIEAASISLKPNLLLNHLPLSARQIDIKVEYK
jgi:hypothetical protein